MVTHLFSTGCYPYYDNDPFILENCPHVYFSGNQPKFQHKKLQGNSVCDTLQVDHLRVVLKLVFPPSLPGTSLLATPTLSWLLACSLPATPSGSSSLAPPLLSPGSSSLAPPLTTSKGDDAQTILVVAVPNFDLTHSCVLVNLRTLECQELTFATSMSRRHNPELEKLLELESQGDHVTSSQPDSDLTLLHHMDMDDDEDD